MVAIALISSRLWYRIYKKNRKKNYSYLEHRISEKIIFLCNIKIEKIKNTHLNLDAISTVACVNNKVE